MRKNKNRPKYRNIKSHVFNGKRYVVKWIREKNGIGCCLPPDAKPKEIHINPDLDARTLLGVLCHESLHALEWNFSEEFVEEAAESIAELLWKANFRLIEN